MSLSTMNPSRLVRETCKRVINDAVNVSISEQHIKALAEIVANDINEIGHIDWDSLGWHFSDDASIGGPLTCQYIFVLDSLNFCFWERPELEYDTLAMSLRDALRMDVHVFDADRLSDVTEFEISSWFPAHMRLPNMTERVRVLRELGDVLSDSFEGKAINLVKLADKSAVKLTKLVLQYLPGFRDCSIYRGYRVDFYKRAQILVGDLWAAYGKNADSSVTNIFAFHDMQELTTFADYRVPQILRHYQVLSYSAQLAYRIDNFEEIPYGSAEETEIRAATVIAVEMLRKELTSIGHDLLSIEIDWFLWQTGEAAKDSIAPHHRTKTIYY